MQPQNSQAALGELTNFRNSRRKSTDILQEQQTRLGMPSAQQRQAGLRGAITNTENLIKAVEPSVSGRTGGSLVTEAQKTRLVGLERQPLDDTFREQNRALEGETMNLNELQRQAQQATQLAVADDDSRENALSGLYGTLYQREQDEISKQERERAYQEELRRARAAEAQSSALERMFRDQAAQQQALLAAQNQKADPRNAAKVAQAVRAADMAKAQVNKNQVANQKIGNKYLVNVNDKLNPFSTPTGGSGWEQGGDWAAKSLLPGFLPIQAAKGLGSLAKRYF